ncbi:hypothetical protein F4821DRAFT_270797 [Hypoxylon rubiginosum]|uniref:Uncharacterized protein n=1 Tax=Hypoxylon rubiginosum TaxID=110542 RepID=A0ACC0CX80_9PEZI|nr:hypothetical protein F4821DRAFT_270797 [Hypoxylon rubiginosum]
MDPSSDFKPLDGWYCRFLENWVYAWPEPPLRKWTKPMDIIFEEPNYSSYWIRLCQLDTVLGHAGAVTDITGSVFAADFVAAYPEAKVVLNYRAWQQSAKITLAGENDNCAIWLIAHINQDALWPWHYIACQAYTELPTAGNMRRGIFCNRKWPIPDEPFPHVNAGMG